MKIKQGDIFQLGSHRIVCGDAKDEELVKRLIGDENVRLILSDPPYGVAYVEGKKDFHVKGGRWKEGNIHREIRNDELQTDEKYADFTQKWLGAIEDKLDAKNAFYIFNSDRMICALRKGIKDSGGYYSQLIIWIKDRAVLGRKDYNPQHELIVYGWFNSHKFERSKGKSVIFCPKPIANKIHPTMKPVELLRKLILNSAKIDEIVYDPFLGSGSTLIACEHVGRRCFGMEIDGYYVEQTIKRWEKLTGGKARK